MHTVILAKSPAEANAYIKAEGLNRRNARYATRAGTVRGLRVSRIIELPGYARRHDRHSINAALRGVEQWTRPGQPRVIREYPVIQLSLADALEEAYPSDLRLAYDDALSVAYPYTDPDDLETDPDDEVADRRRRSRCKICGNLTWGPDDEAHDSELHAEQIAEEPLTVANFWGQ